MIFYKNRPILACAVLLYLAMSIHAISAQEDTDDTMDLLSELDQIQDYKPQPVIATFKSTRILATQSIERVQKDQLHFRISHLFGAMDGVSNLFGLDQLNNMHFSFEYGLTDAIQFGFFRSNKPDVLYALTGKYSIARQTIGDKGSFPLSISFYTELDIVTSQLFPEQRDRNFTGRLTYLNQILVARKINTEFSLQLSPTWVHRNLTTDPLDPNDVFALAVGGRYSVSRSTSVNIDYVYTLPTFERYNPKANGLVVGIDVETGGHVFQLFVTNASSLNIAQLALNQNQAFGMNNIRFGFSMLREFSVGKKSEKVEE